MKVEILVLLTLGALVSSLPRPLNSEWDSVWDEWKTKHGKEYDEIAEGPRRRIWEKNMRLIDQHNLEAAEGNHSYTMGMNQFGDMTHQEFKAMLSVDQSHVDEMPAVSEWNMSVSIHAPLDFDWRAAGRVTPVKNQGKCGSCYAFAAIGALEAHLAIKKGAWYSLSEQELVDCSGDYQRKPFNGCGGGSARRSLKYVRDKGIRSEKKYPYTGEVGKCKRLIGPPIARCKGYERVPANNEAAMKEALFSVGPLAVSVNSDLFKFYNGGVFYVPKASTKTNHAVLAVGYGVKSQWYPHDYWIVKNSWGTTWGLQGYILIARGNNQFGIATRPLYPLM